MYIHIINLIKSDISHYDTERSPQSMMIVKIPSRFAAERSVLKKHRAGTKCKFEQKIRLHYVTR